MSLTTRTIVGEIVYGDGTGGSGTLRFTPEALVAVEGKVILPGPVVVVAGNGGTFEVDLVVTDAEGYNPENWVWKVEESFPGGRTFMFELPSGEEPVPYTQLIPATSIADPFAAHEHTQYITFDDIGEVVAGVNTVNGLDGDVTLGAADVGAYPDDNPAGFVDASGASQAAPVQSVNSQTGNVTLDASDVGAYPDDNPSGFIDAAGAPVQSVNGETGTVNLSAADVGAYPDSNPDGFVDSSGAAAASPVQSVNTQTGDVSLTASDVGAYPDDNPSGFVDASGAAAAAPVQSVNGETGDVDLDASDVGALPDDAALDDLSDVDVSEAVVDDLLAYDGTNWVATSEPKVQRVSFDTATPGELDAAGDLAWRDMDQALSYRTNGITVDIAQENLIYVRNPQGAPTISAGQAVAFAGASANRVQVQPCKADEPGVGCATAGIALNTIGPNSFGFVSTFGLVRGFDTNNILTDGGPPATEGQELFISTTPGVLATFPAPSPARRVTVGYVVTVGTNGSIFVTVRRGLTVNELDNVLASSPTDGQTLTWDNTDGVWKPVTPTPAPVTSVNTQTGAVVLDATDVGAYPDTNPSNFIDAAGAPVQSVNGETGTVSLSAADVGAYPDDNPSAFVDAAGAAAASPVQSVNTQTGDVTLSASDVGAYPDDNPSGFVDSGGAASAAPVQSVNSQTGDVSLSASDVGAYPDNNPDAYVDAQGAANAAPVQSVNGETGTVSLTASDVGAYPDDNPSAFVDAAGAASAAPVQSVNGETGTVTLTAADVDAYPDTNPSSFVDAAGAAAAAPVQSVNGETGAVSLSASDVNALPDDAELGDLDDVDVTGVNDGDFLSYDDNTGNWVAVPAPEGNGAPALLEGMFTPQTPVPGNYHYTKNGRLTGRDVFFSPFTGNLTPIQFTEEATISRMAIIIASNAAIAQGGSADGYAAWFAIYDSDANGIPSSPVAQSPKLEIFPPDAQDPPGGAFTAPGGPLAYDFPTAVTLDANERYWIGILVRSNADPNTFQNQPLSYVAYESVDIGDTLTGEDGVAQTLFEQGQFINSSRTIIPSLFATQFNFDDDPLPTLIPSIAFPAGSAALTGVLEQPGQ